MIALFLFGLALAVDEKKQQEEHKPDAAPPQHAVPAAPTPDHKAPAPVPDHKAPALAPGHIVQAPTAAHKAAAKPTPTRRPKPTRRTTTKRPTKEPHQTADKIGSKSPGNLYFEVTKNFVCRFLFKVSGLAVQGELLLPQGWENK